MLRSIKRIIPNSTKDRLKSKFSSQPADFPYTKTDGKKMAIFLCGYYQNLGDMAITYAQKKFLSDNFSDYDIITVPSYKTYEWMKSLKSIIGSDDIITIIGGGNMSPNYPSLEDSRRFVMENFKGNKIISFPQTCDFDINDKTAEFKRTVNAYGKVHDLTLFARESTSYERMKEIFSNAKVGLCPDIVLYLNKSEPKVKRSGALFCFRDDVEQSISNDSKVYILKALENLCGDVTKIDTTDIAFEDCSEDRLEGSVNGFLDKIVSSRLVLTDRLHCMIFCAITGTPCIAFDNANKKISSVKNDWMGDFEYIKIHTDDDISTLDDEIKSLLEVDASNLKIADLSEKFKPLKSAIEN